MSESRVIVISEAELRRVVTEAVREAVGERENDLRMLTAEEAGERLGVGPRTILKWAKSGRLPCRKLGPGKVLRFVESEILAAGAERKAG